MFLCWVEFNSKFKGKTNRRNQKLQIPTSSRINSTIKINSMYKLELIGVWTGTPGPAGYKEKFTKIDNEKLIKETEVVEGGYLEFGFTLFRVRFEIIEKGEDSSIIKTTIEYEIKEEHAANASFVSIEPLANIMEVAKNYLKRNKAAKEAK